MLFSSQFCFVQLFLFSGTSWRLVTHYSILQLNDTKWILVLLERNSGYNLCIYWWQLSFTLYWNRMQIDCFNRALSNHQTVCCPLFFTLKNVLLKEKIGAVECCCIFFAFSLFFFFCIHYRSITKEPISGVSLLKYYCI